MNTPFVIFLILFHCNIGILSSQSSNCSALHAFVEVNGSQSSGLHNVTLISSQALFPPYSYSIPFTPLVVLSSEDDICSSNVPFSTIVTNRVLLLFESIGNCTIHSKIVSAQLHGATAVLIANNDDSGQVVNIADDDTLTNITTTIAMRSISKQDAQLLSDALLSNHLIQIKIGCFKDISYPSILCVSDTSGTFYFRSGEYQQQVHLHKNAHPVWKMHGYPLWRQDVYIYLHDAHGDTDWFWAVTIDETLADDTSIRLKCAVGSLSNPSLCPLWKGTYNSGASFVNAAGVNVTAGLCPIGGQQICIQSDQYSLAGLSGTYTLHTNGAPEWFRDLTECDMRAAALFYAGAEQSSSGKSFFYLNDPLQSITIAHCFLSTQQTNNDTMKWKPNACDAWFARDDIGLRFGEAHFYGDDTLRITIGECEDKALCAQTSTAPSTLCMANNSIFHGVLMGNFIKLNKSGPYFESPMYQRVASDDFDLMSSENIYMWYTNELYASLGFSADYMDRRLWILSAYSYDDAYKAGTYEYYGYCQGSAYGNPLNCNGWIFEENSAHHFDEEMTVTEGECSIDPTPSIPDIWPQYICMDLKNKSIDSAALNQLSSVDTSYFIGGYAINMSAITDEHPFPEWIKPYNDIQAAAVKLYLTDDGRWQINDDDISRMKCDAYYKTNSFNPVECKRWYDDVYELLDNIYVYECSAHEVWTASPTAAPTAITLAPSASPSASPTTPTLSPTMLRMCLSRNGSMQSMLEGVATAVSARGEYDTMELVKWSLNEEFIPNLFVWYHDNKWVLSPQNYTTFAASEQVDDALVYGYCFGGMHPADSYPVCEECWQFYWSLSALNSEESEYLTDCSFIMSSDLNVCDFSDVYDGDIEYVERLCVSVADGAIVDDDVSALLGEYVRTEGILREYFSVETTSFYMLADSSNIGYIWHDRVTNYWFVGATQGTNPVLLCHEKNEVEMNGIPVECMMWDDMLQTSVLMEDIYIVSMSDDEDECGEEVIGKSKKKKVSIAAEIIIGIICGLIAIALMRLMWAQYRKHRDVKRVRSLELRAINREICETETQTIALQKQGYDMSTLNKDGIDDDDDEMDQITDVDDTNDPLNTDVEEVP